MPQKKTLRQLRLSVDITQAELAKRAGVPQSCISKLEHGLYVGNTDIRERVASALQVNVKRIQFDRPEGA